MKTVTMIFVSEKGQKTIQQSPQMLDMAARIEAVGGVDIVPMHPISERVFLAYDAQKNPDGPMYDGWEGEQKLIYGKGLLFRMVGMMVKDLTAEDIEKTKDAVRIIGVQIELGGDKK